jgi:hypothetical protein
MVLDLQRTFGKLPVRTVRNRVFVNLVKNGGERYANARRTPRNSIALLVEFPVLDAVSFQANSPGLCRVVSLGLAGASAELKLPVS